MVEITSTMVKDLREKTQAGMMDCKKALTESNGDFDAAVKYLREKGLSAASKRADRSASQGLIAIKKDGGKYAMVELNSETDFVAKNETFGKLLDELLDTVLANEPADLESFNQNKLSDGKTVTEAVTEAIAVIGENIIARRFYLMQDEGGYIESYTHMNNSIGVLVKFSGEIPAELSKDIAMHIAAAAPAYLNIGSVPQADLDEEKAIFKKQALNEGKPENIVEKIAEGKIGKFYKENCLLEQQFVKDSDKQIKDILPEGVNIVEFARFQLGAE